MLPFFILLIHFMFKKNIITFSIRGNLHHSDKKSVMVSTNHKFVDKLLNSGQCFLLLVLIYFLMNKYL